MKQSSVHSTINSANLQNTSNNYENNAQILYSGAADGSDRGGNADYYFSMNNNTHATSSSKLSLQTSINIPEGGINVLKYSTKNLIKLKQS